MPLSSFQPNNYTHLLELKKEKLKQLLAEFTTCDMAVYSSPVSGFRMRAEFRFWHNENSAFYAMFAKGDNIHPVEIPQLPIAHPNINRLMEELLKQLLANDILRKKLYQVDFLTTLNNDNLITLIYHQKLDETWHEQAIALEKAIGASIIGRSRQQRIVVSKDYVSEVLEVNGKPLHYKQMEGGFTQPNAYLNQAMLGWAQQQAQNSSSDLLELYCGNGNFTVALAPCFNKVLATEISKPSVEAAKYNFAKNNIGNVQVCRMSSEDISSALKKERVFKRLAAQGINIENYQFSTVLVDPPRAGLDPATLSLVQQFDRIIYISCNPLTLADNLKTLCQTHSIKSVAMFDQFPYTEHIETGVYLEKHQ
jgi:tRNA (uracil-5-)-methyltransferase